MKKEHIGFKCTDCQTINFFPCHKQDGNRCTVCKGYLVPIGYVVMGIDLGRGKDLTGYPPSKKIAF